MTNETKAILYYAHDPMCSWCWGFKENYHALVKNLPKSVHLVRLLGGLAPDSDQPMSEDMQNMLQQTWHRIEAMIPATKFNFDFWKSCQPIRSTFPACRAVIAARQQGSEYDLIMTEAIESAYYQQARNPSLDQTLFMLADEIGLDNARFEADYFSHGVNQELTSEIQLCRELYLESFPALALLIGKRSYSIPIDYLGIEPMLASINGHLNEIKA